MSDIQGLDRRALERARISRDARFDGRFFIGVTSTGIYCRPICPSPTSKSANVRYFPTAEAAAEAGFRPCLRCRPEAAPGTPAWQGTAAAVRRALRLIDDGLLDNGSVDELSARIGVSPRHLHRLFLRHVGAPPSTVAQTRRLHFAKRLLDETSLPVTEVALAAGFGSIRRFNDSMRATYGRSPSELRRQRRSPNSPLPGGEVALRLAYRPPYDWTQVRDFFRQRAVPGLERVDDRGYSRVVTSADGPAIVRVRPIPGEHALELRVLGAAPMALLPISDTARRAFDLAADPMLIGAAFASDSLVGPMARRRPGLRIAGAWDPFECVARAIIARDDTSTVGRALAARVVKDLGARVRGESMGLTHAFPSPAAILRSPLEGLGLKPRQAAGLRALSRRVIEKDLDFGAPIEEVLRKLKSVPGMDESTTEYVALMALGQPDALPSKNQALRRRVIGKVLPLHAQDLATRAEAWRPWRSYAAMHLWCA